MSAGTDWRVWQDAAVAGRFASQRRGGLLGAEAQFDTMLRLLAYVPARPLTVLDLGCGDGVVLDAVASAFPIERAVALDGSPAMLERASERFAASEELRGRTECVQADFNDGGWADRLPARAFDAVVSAFAIHHSEDAQKRAIYAQVFDRLRPGGVFVNIEHVASHSAHGEELFETAYAETVWRWRQAQGESVPLADVLRELRDRPDKAANRLASMEAQLQWLREIGFVDVDCYWKQFELAVLAGYRASE